MTDSVQILLINDSASSWIVDYRIAETPHTLTLAPEGVRQVLATHFLDGSEWLELKESKAISANEGIASLHPDTSVYPVVEALTIFMGLLCGAIFWINANPLRK